MDAARRSLVAVARIERAGVPSLGVEPVKVRGRRGAPRGTALTARTVRAPSDMHDATSLTSRHWPVMWRSIRATHTTAQWVTRCSQMRFNLRMFALFSNRRSFGTPWFTLVPVAFRRSSCSLDCLSILLLSRVVYPMTLTAVGAFRPVWLLAVRMGYDD